MRATYLTQSGIRLLNDWGAALRRMFPAETAYLVGSALTTADHRDVDVRLMLDDHAIDLLASVMNLADLNLAVSLWGQQVTGLPIDFQVQRMTDANAEYDGRRHPLGRLVADDGVPVGGGEPQPTTSTDNDLRRHDPNDDDPVTRAGKAAAALRYAVDLPPYMRDLAYEQVKAGLDAVRSAGGGDQPDTPCPQCDGSGEEEVTTGNSSWRPCPVCTDKETPHGH